MFALRRTATGYRARSHWARGPHTAGPLERFSMRNWIRDASVARPMIPPKASTSLATTPFATPPMAGLQLICPMRERSGVTRTVRQPSRADAAAASVPA